MIADDGETNSLCLLLWGLWAQMMQRYMAEPSVGGMEDLVNCIIWLLVVMMWTIGESLISLVAPWIHSSLSDPSFRSWISVEWYQWWDQWQHQQGRVCGPANYYVVGFVQWRDLGLLVAEVVGSLLSGS